MSEEVNKWSFDWLIFKVLGFVLNTLAMIVSLMSLKWGIDWKISTTETTDEKTFDLDQKLSISCFSKNRKDNQFPISCHTDVLAIFQ